MNKRDFYYSLPDRLIAQTPLEKRDNSKLMYIDKTSGKVVHNVFSNLAGILKPNDLLVMNNSRVLPARIYGKKISTGADIEFLLLEEKERNVWEVILKPGRRAKKNAEFSFGNGLIHAEVLDVLHTGNRLVKFDCKDDFFASLEKIGHMPLPPYITEKLEDNERYQTVYSKELGSAAAPTAGLHFTMELLNKLKNNAIDVAYITLHVGLGTFRPVKTENILKHHMHAEHYCLDKECADKINTAKKNGGRIIAVGTTSCRTLEAVALKYGKIKPDSDYTDIFIYPGKKFNAIDGLITNFHLPQSTLIMLVCAFGGYKNIMNAYKNAVENDYRFFSFGDAMIVI